MDPWRQPGDQFGDVKLRHRDPLAVWKDLRNTPEPSARRILAKVPDDLVQAVKDIQAMGYEPIPEYLRKKTRYWTAVKSTMPRTREEPGRHQVEGTIVVDASEVWQNGPFPFDLGRLLAGVPLADLWASASVKPFRLRSGATLDARTNDSVPGRTDRGESDSAEDTPSGDTTPPSPVIAVIDDRCGFLHEQFCHADVHGKPRTTRLLRFWDQSRRDDDSTVQAPWQDPPHFGYGRELAREDIDLLLAELHQGGSERDRYAAIGFPLAHEMSEGNPRWSHGTHVLAIAGGRSDPFAEVPDAPDEVSSLDLLAVQLPTSAVQKTHGVWLNAYVLDALHYILDNAPAPRPVVVNISMGGSLGPHDGSSLLEEAIDALIEESAGRLTVVLAAGNAREDRLHAARVLEPMEAVSFCTHVPSDDDTPNFVDLWIHGSQGLGIELGVARHLVGKEEPEDQTRLQPGATALYVNADGRVSALAIVHRAGHAPNGRDMQAFVAIGHTSLDMTQAPALHGDWRITVRNTSSTQEGDGRIRVSAWIARDDVPSGHSLAEKPHQSVFEDDATIETSGTISSLCGGASTIVVGGYASAAPEACAMYAGSGAGFVPQSGAPGRAIRGPDVCGPAADGESGVPDVWFLSDEPVIEPTSRTRKGTSMAAPYVARRLALCILRSAGEPLSRQGLLDGMRRHFKKHEPGGTQADQAWTSSLWV